MSGHAQAMIDMQDKKVPTVAKIRDFDRDLRGIVEKAGSRCRCLS